MRVIGRLSLPRLFYAALAGMMLAVLAGGSGCSSGGATPRVIFLDGAGHFGSGSKVKKGLRSGGYTGAFEVFMWTSYLGWGVDHLVEARRGKKAEKLAERIVEIRMQDRDGYLALMGLSAGTAVILDALERLPDDVLVDYVVLFQSSVSSDRDLTVALRHVKYDLLATSARWDAILAALPVSADGHFAEPAGRAGFQRPADRTAAERRQYSKVVNIPWKKSYARYGWGRLGDWHVSSTSSQFVRRVIAPHIRRTVRGPSPPLEYPEDEEHQFERAEQRHHTASAALRE